MSFCDKPVAGAVASRGARVMQVGAGGGGGLADGGEGEHVDGSDLGGDVGWGALDRGGGAGGAGVMIVEVVCHAPGP
jgi:hypothetical protein